MITFDSNCLYIIQCLALVFLVAPCVLFAGRHADLWAVVVRAAHYPRHAPAAAGPAAVWALPLLGHRPVPTVRPQYAG